MAVIKSDAYGHGLVPVARAKILVTEKAPGRHLCRGHRG